jgi:Calx-beta domain/Peptidase M10 serralysin C terminal
VAPATLSIAATSASKAEGNSSTTPFTFTVTRSNGAGASSANWALQHTTTAAADFSGSTTGLVSFADGETSKVITLNVTGDTTSENDETFSVTLSAATNATIATATASGTIVDDDTALYSIVALDANKIEGNTFTSPSTSFTFTVSRTLSTGTGSVFYSITPGTASFGPDYTGFNGGTVNFAAGETSKTITVPVVGDSVVEGDETFSITLSNPVNGRLDAAATTASATIINDDLPGIDGSTATTTSFTVPAEVPDNIDNIVDGIKWGDAVGTGVTLTYSFSSSTSVFRNPGTYEQTYEGLNTAQRAAAVDVMNRLSAVANITFVEVADTATSAGDIRWTRSTVAALGSTSYAYFPSTLAAGGDVWIGPSPLYDNPTPGGGAFSVILHELGHAMGLEHPHEGAPAALPGEDQIKYSLMSYKAYDGAPAVGATGGYLPTSYMLNDIAALQYLYGANTTTNAGNNVYTWSSTSVVYECLWDTGGTDTISGASQAQACTINLNAGQWSTIGVGYDVDIYTAGTQLARDTLTIGYNVTIENAVGSGFADALVGNAVANVLTGGAGADTLTGGAGADTFRFVTSSEGGDQLTDFLSGTDVIEVVSSNFGGLPVGNATGFFVSGTVPVASGSGAFFLFDTDDRTLTFDSNGTAAGGTTLIASLNSGAVTASDLRIVSA